MRQRVDKRVFQRRHIMRENETTVDVNGHT